MPATVTTQIVKDITETLSRPEGWMGMASPESERVNLPVSKQKAFDKAPGSSPSDVCRNGEACAAFPQEKPHIAELWRITIEGKLPYVEKGAVRELETSKVYEVISNYIERAGIDQTLILLSRRT